MSVQPLPSQATHLDGESRDLFDLTCALQESPSTYIHRHPALVEAMTSPAGYMSSTNHHGSGPIPNFATVPPPAPGAHPAGNIHTPTTNPASGNMAANIGGSSNTNTHANLNPQSTTSPFPFSITSPYPLLQFPSTGLTPKFPTTLALLPLASLATSNAGAGAGGAGAAGAIGDLDDVVRGLEGALALVSRCEGLLSEMQRLQEGVFGRPIVERGERAAGARDEGAGGAGAGGVEVVGLDARGVGPAPQPAAGSRNGEPGSGQAAAGDQLGLDGEQGEGPGLEGAAALGGWDVVMGEGGPDRQPEQMSRLSMQDISKLELVHLEYTQTLQSLLALAQTSLLAPLPIPASQASPAPLSLSHAAHSTGNTLGLPIPTGNTLGLPNPSGNTLGLPNPGSHALGIPDSAANPLAGQLTIDHLAEWVERRGVVEFGRKEAVRAGAKAVLDTLRIDVASSR